MGKGKLKLQLNEKNSFILADNIFQAVSIPYSMINKKLIQLTYAHIYKMQNIMFQDYYDSERMKFVNRKEYAIHDGINYYDTIDCCEKGWNWQRFTGPGDEEQINKSGVFTWECSLFMYSYQLYAAVQENGLEYEQFMGEGAMDKLVDQVIAFAEWNEYGVLDAMFDNTIITPDEYVTLIAYGSIFIEDKMSGKKMSAEHEQELIRLYNLCHSKFVPGALDYYDSFFCDFDYFQMDDSCMKKLYPYLLDLMFALKSDEDVVTPCLYIYTSDSMKEYRDIRKLYIGSKYIPYLDKLIVLLEDPMGVRKLQDSPELYETDIIGMRYNENYSALLAYTDTCYLGVYYSYHHKYDSKLNINPFFKPARQLFEMMLNKMKKEGCNIKSEST